MVVGLIRKEYPINNVISWVTVNYQLMFATIHLLFARIV